MSEGRSHQSPDAGCESAARQVSQTLEDSLRLLREARLADTGPAARERLAVVGERSALPAGPIRTIHQFACSGGTLICKCVAAMPNVQLLSEVDPLFPGPVAAGTQPRFTPSDMPALLRASTRGASESLIARVFQAELRVVHEDAVAAGLRLVLRDHAHTHYCRGSAVPDRPSLRSLVSALAPVLSIVTVRHPADSFASLVGNGWVHFTPPDFETYCQRYLRFIDDHADVPIVRYEDLATAPEATMRRICEILDLPYAEDFATLFSEFSISGDSGRSGSDIQVRPRRPEATALLGDSHRIPSYGLLASRLGYGPADALRSTRNAAPSE